MQVAQIAVSGEVKGSVRPPGSKSLSNRALVCAALADGRSELHGLLKSEDTEVMLDSWHRLGLKVDVDWSKHLAVVQGCSGDLPKKQGSLYVANSGTTIRFLTAALAACQGEFVLDGVARMRERPIGDLLIALQKVGVEAVSLNEQRPDCPPVRMRTEGIAGGRVSVNGSVSSQFLSGLLLASPYAKGALEIEVEGELVSRPYVEMTRQVMRDFGVDTQGASDGPWRIEAPRVYQAIRYEIEPDASAASYFWGAAAITGGEVRVDGLSRKSLQGDVAFCDVLEKMGCHVVWGDNSVTVSGRAHHGVDVDMANISDTVQTLAAVALFAETPTRVRGVAHNRYKETDRIGDLARELRKLGAEVNEYEDGLEIHPSRSSQKPLHGARLKTYHDHRMAMSLALVGLRIEGVEIEDPGCTAKTYPNYFEDLSALISKPIPIVDVA